MTVGDLEIDASRNLKHLKNLSNLEIIPSVHLFLQMVQLLTLGRHNTLQPLPEMSNVDQIYHLACPTKEQYEDDPVQALESCFIGTKNLLDVALRCNARVVLANISTAKGLPIPLPKSHQGSWDDRLRQRKRKRSPETSTPTSTPTAKRRRGPKTPVPPVSRSYYDEGNRLAQMLCAAYEEHFGLDVRIAHMPQLEHQHTPKKPPKSGDTGDVTLTIDLPTAATLTESEVTTFLQPSIENDDSLRALVDSMDAPGPARPVSSGPISE